MTIVAKISESSQVAEEQYSAFWCSQQLIMNPCIQFEDNGLVMCINRQIEKTWSLQF